ncbi:hypothetical protein PC120_g12305 [Phytophthora cactorum]|nr:hypothetical protein PC120_g12305 [Phytophthora cactorum]
MSAGTGGLSSFGGALDRPPPLVGDPEYFLRQRASLAPDPRLACVHTEKVATTGWREFVSIDPVQTY